MFLIPSCLVLISKLRQPTNSATSPRSPSQWTFRERNVQYLNSKVSDNIKTLANTLITCDNSGYVMMTLFIIKEGTGNIPHLESAILN